MGDVEYKKLTKLGNAYSIKILQNIENLMVELNVNVPENGLTTRDIASLLTQKRVSHDGKRIINNYGLPSIHKLAMLLKRDVRFMAYKRTVKATTQWSLVFNEEE
tara:strand:+ start:3824 stop:4138 length:315 start_codon:yes stop_codon:yes gene_type:complete